MKIDLEKNDFENINGNCYELTLLHFVIKIAFFECKYIT